MVENESYKSTTLSSLTRYLKFQHLDRFDFVGPGNEIPEWYNHQSVRSLISLELLPGWLSNKWKGFACCVIFRLPKPLLPSVEMFIRCSLTASGKTSNMLSPLFGGKWGKPVLDHVWFCYVHRDDGYCFRHEWQDIYYQLEFSFKLIPDRYWNGNEVEIPQVKKCGVRMVYEEDEEELRQTLLKQSNTKRGLQHYYDDDAASSSTASQEEEEEPHPKRFKRLELDGAGPSHDQKHD